MSILQQVYTIPSMVTGASVTSSLEIPGTFVYTYLVIPTMTAYSAGTVIYLQGSPDGTNFYRMSNLETNTTPVGTNDFQIASGISGRIVALPNFAVRYVKVEVSATVSGGVVPAPFKIIAISNQ